VDLQLEAIFFSLFDLSVVVRARGAGVPIRVGFLRLLPNNGLMSASRPYQNNLD